MRDRIHRAWGTTGLLLLAAAAPTPAAAHHVMGGRLPSTFIEGLLSGLGHPVIGPDHLAFIVALGIASALLSGGLASIAAFIACSTAGVLIHVARLDVPLSETLVALSVLLAGAALIWNGGMTRTSWLALAAVAGLFHGYAFGESIVGAERGALGAYLIGIAIVTTFIAVIVMQVARKIMAPVAADSPRLRAAGMVLGAIGVVLLASSLVFGAAP